MVRYSERNTAAVERQISRKHRHTSSSRRKMVLWLSLACGVLFALLLFQAVKLGIYAKENEQLIVIENMLSRELETLRPEVEVLKANIAELVEARLPNLNELKFDEVIPISRDYVRNIVFTLAKKQGIKRYEYKLVMDNRGYTTVSPQITLLFFDGVGIQVGSSDIGIDKDGDPTLDVLERGEIRTHSAHVEIPDDLDPDYFMVRILKASPPSSL